MKNIKYLNKKNYLLIIFSFLLLSIISVILFLHSNTLFDAYDMQFHIKRIMELKDSVDHGNFFPLYSINYFHGSALMSMYPYFSLFPMILFLFITSSFIKAYYLFFIFILFLSLLISFFSSRKFSKSIAISYLFSICYSMSTMFVMNTFTNGDWGVTTSLIFMPLVIFGFINLLNNNRNYIELAVGTSLMLFCQLSALTIVLMFLFCWLIINLTKINKKIFLNIVKSAILFVLITSFIWIPLFHVILLNTIKSITLYKFQGVGVKALIKYVSLPSLISIMIVPLYFTRINRLMKQMYIFSVVIIILSSNFIPWGTITTFKPFKILNQFQFAFRFLIIPQILLSYLFSYICVKYISKHVNYKFLIGFISMLVVALQVFTQASVIHTRMYENHININSIEKPKVALTHNYRYIVHNNKGVYYLANGFLNIDDYYPKSATSQANYINNNNGIMNGRKILHIRRQSYNRFIFYSSKHINKLILPILHYNGEKLHLYYHNNLLNYSVNNHHLLVLQNLSPGDHEIEINYVPNIKIFIIEFLLSLLGFLWMLIILTNNYTKRRG